MATKKIRHDILWRMITGILLLLPLSARANVELLKARTQTNTITFMTKRSVGQEVKLKIKAQGAVTAQGLDGEIDIMGEYARDYKLTSQTVTLTGDIVALDCFSDEITELYLSPAHTVTSLNCCDNYLQGDAMTRLFESLPNRTTLEKGCILVFDTNVDDANHALKSDVSKALAKNWEVLQFGSWWAREPYIGNDDPIKPIGSEEIIFTTAKNKGEKLTISLLASSPVEADGILGNVDINGNEVEYTLNSNTITLRGTITQLSIKGNLITSLSLSEDSKIEYLELSNNYLIAPQVETLIGLLPSRRGKTEGELIIFDSTVKEFNYCSTANVTSAKIKGWKVSQHDKDHNIIPYEGETSTAPAQDKAAHTYLKTDRKIGEKLSLKVESLGPVTAIGLEGTIIPDGKRREFIISSQEIQLAGSIKSLDCSGNELTALRFEKTKDLEIVMCDNNRIADEAMKQLISSLPDRTGQSKGKMLVFEGNIDDANRCLISDVAKAREKNWQMQQWFAGRIVPYAGYGELPEGGKITILTDKKAGDTFSMKVVAEGPVSVLGIEEDLSIDDLYNDYTLTESTITIYGAVKILECYSNQITSIDITEATKLNELNCYGNKLTSLDLSKAPLLTTLVCDDNLLVGKAMTKMIQSLPDRNDREKKAVAVVFDSSRNDANRCLASDVAIALKKNWQTAQWANVSGELTAIPYAGYDAVVNDERISMTTAKAIGDKIQLSIVALGPISAKGIKETISASGSPLEYTLTDKEIIIKGAVSVLYCYGNELTALDVSQNKSLVTLVCDDNLIVGNNMTSLVRGIPDRSKEPKTGNFVVYDSGLAEDGNRCLVSDIEVVSQRGWMPTQWVKSQDGQRSPAMYLGYDMETGRETVTFTTDMPPGEKVTLALDALTPIVAEGLNEGIKKSKEDQLYTLNAPQVTLKGSLRQLKLSGNKLTTLCINDTNYLERIECQNNKLSEEATNQLIESLPNRKGMEEGSLVLFDATIMDSNVCSKEYVAKALRKNWRVLQVTLNNGQRVTVPYDGYNSITTLDTSKVKVLPSRDFTTINVEGALSYSPIALYDGAGLLLFYGRANSHGASKIDVSSYPRGMYFLKVANVSISIILE